MQKQDVNSVPLDFAGFTLDVTDVRIGITGAALVFCKVRQISLMSMSVRSASQPKMP